MYKQRAFNYLGISHHHLYEQIERLIMEMNGTPAEAAGELANRAEAQVSLRGLIKFLHVKLQAKN